MAQTVRRFSPAGPCIPVGELVKETPKFFFSRDPYYGRVIRIGKRGTLVHIEPCRSCRDHPETQYPNGYMD